jgi:hypothetical protein
MNENPMPHEVRITLTLAKCLALADDPDYESQLRATSAVNTLQLHHPLTLLSFAASLLVLERFTADPPLLGDARPGLEFLAGRLRIWVGRDGARTVGLGPRIRGRVVERCLIASKTIMGVAESEDAGYASQSDSDGGRNVVLESGKVAGEMGILSSSA